MGGPDAPALSKALALGDGGGSTMPEECDPSVPVRRVESAPVPLAEPGGEEPAVPLPSSEGSSGICRASLGRLAFSCALLVLEGGAKASFDETEALRCFACVFVRCRGWGGGMGVCFGVASPSTE